MHYIDTCVWVYSCVYIDVCSYIYIYEYTSVHVFKITWMKQELILFL